MSVEGIPLLILPCSPPFPFRNQLCKDLVVFLYHENTVDVGYNQKVDNTMYFGIHNKYWLKLKLQDNAN